MSIPIALKRMLESSNEDTFSTAQAAKVGVSKEKLSLLAKTGELERVYSGVYVLPGEFIDEMYAYQLRRPKIIYSHETALYLHDLTDRDPINYVATVPTGYNTKNLREDGFEVYSVRKDLYGVGITRMQTVWGHTVTTYNMERTICDCLRSRNRMDYAIVFDAVKRYVRLKDRNIVELSRMAKLFKVDKRVSTYLEVLL